MSEKKSKISAFSKKEIEVLEKVSALFLEKGKDIYQTFKNRKKDLDVLALLVSRTAPLRSKERHGMEKRDISTMAEAISSTGTANPLLIPTRATMGRCFVITKINFFFFILKVIMPDKVDCTIAEEIQKSYSKMIFSLMAEEAYESIIDNNLSDKKNAKAAAEELAHLWEYRMDRNLDEFSPPLMALWKERCGIVPILGTLKGTMEILRLSINLPTAWVEFLAENSSKEGVAEALEEFVFGLSYEEIKHLRGKMKMLSISAIDRKQAIEVLKNECSYSANYCHSIFFEGDAKEIYNFFHQRLTNALRRKLIGENPEGPKKTIEEFFLIHLLEKKKGNIAVIVKNSFTKLLNVFKK